MNVEDSVLYCGLDHVFIFIIISHNVILVENNTSERLFTKILHLENIEHNYIIPFACISDWCCCEPELKPGKAARLALSPLGDSSDGSTWGKWTGQGPWLSNRLLSVFFFFYSPLPDKDQQSGCSIFSEDITGREKGGAKRLLFCFLYRSAARMAVYRRGPSWPTTVPNTSSSVMNGLISRNIKRPQHPNFKTHQLVHFKLKWEAAGRGKWVMLPQWRFFSKCSCAVWPKLTSVRNWWKVWGGERESLCLHYTVKRELMEFIFFQGLCSRSARCAETTRLHSS